MFRGDSPDLTWAYFGAIAVARDLGHARVGTEHLLLSLSRRDDRLGQTLQTAGVTPAAIESVLGSRGFAGAALEADRAALGLLGIDFDRLRQQAEASLGPGAIDARPGRAPLLPLGSKRARERCSRTDPPIGYDAQAAYEASLRLALARREKEHRVEHLALALVDLDAGVSWLLERCGVDRRSLRADLTERFPLPRRNVVLRVERRLGWRMRYRGLVHRFELGSGRPAATRLGYTLSGARSPAARLR